MEQQTIDILPALPEIFVACMAMLLLLYGVFRGDSSSRFLSWFSVLVLIAAGAGVLVLKPDSQAVLFSGLFIADDFAVFAKILILLGSAIAVVMSIEYNEREGIARFEFPILCLIATLGMMMMVSANDLLSLYVGIELQSLSLYVIAAFRRDSVKSTEAGLKYFVLGALSSGMLLYGASMVYGFAGTTNFDGLAEHFVQVGGPPSIGIIVGIVFIVAGLAFKVSAFPFHMWTPDVYEGAPTPVTAFFSAAPKLAAVALFVRVMVDPFGDLVASWQQIIWFLSLGSMVLGSFAAINQRNIKRLLAYSAIAHIGFALIGLASGTEAGVRSVLIYMAIYIVMTLGAFGVVLCMRRHGRMVEDISDLAGLSKTHPVLALAMGIFMFSLAGIPPLAGFFGKLYVFLAAIEAGLVGLAVLGVLTSVVGAYYYLNIVKVMYFDEPAEALDKGIGRSMVVIETVTGAATALFFLYPGPLLVGAAAAVKSLTGG